jgi:hypothetical protein
MWTTHLPNMGPEYYTNQHQGLSSKGDKHLCHMYAALQPERGQS